MDLNLYRTDRPTEFGEYLVFYPKIGFHSIAELDEAHPTWEHEGALWAGPLKEHPVAGGPVFEPELVTVEPEPRRSKTLVTLEARVTELEGAVAALRADSHAPVDLEAAVLAIMRRHVPPRDRVYK